MGSTKQVKYRRDPKTSKAQPIVLIGFMGCGKSTLGPRLARRLGLPFVDLDVQIIELAGRPIAEIFEKTGEQGFRALESLALRKALRSRKQVIAAGGGVVKSSKNRDILRRSGAIVVWLDVAWADLWMRLKTMKGRTRPLLLSSSGMPRPQSAVRALWSQRRPLYRQASTNRVRIRAAESTTVTVGRLALIIVDKKSQKLR